MKLNRRLVLTLVASAAVLSGAAMAQQRVFFGIATGGTGGTYYPLGGMLAQLISNKATVDGRKFAATAEAAGASVANAKLLGGKEIESAFVAADILDQAFNGKAQFANAPIKNLRALGALYPETVQLITRADSRIDASGAAPVTLGERNESGGLGRSVASDAGSISLQAAEGLLFDGLLEIAGRRFRI